MGKVTYHLYHVRGSAPTSGARTLRFRNTFKGLSCLFAASDRDRAIQEWYSRFLTSTYGSVSKVIWTDTEIQIHVSKQMHWDKIDAELQRVKAYVYTFKLDDNWNRHPEKDCYITRSNVHYDKASVQSVDFTTAITGRQLKIIATEQA
jgi:hypothetical protein